MALHFHMRERMLDFISLPPTIPDPCHATGSKFRATRAMRTLRRLAAAMHHLPDRSTHPAPKIPTARQRSRHWATAATGATIWRHALIRSVDPLQPVGWFLAHSDVGRPGGQAFHLERVADPQLSEQTQVLRPAKVRAGVKMHGQRAVRSAVQHHQRTAVVRHWRSIYAHYAPFGNDLTIGSQRLHGATGPGTGREHDQ